MKNRILFLPTRYFPSISGAEFYLQRMAEILSEKYNYEVDIFTSNAIDFKALRNPNGKIVRIGAAVAVINKAPTILAVIFSEFIFKISFFLISFYRLNFLGSYVGNFLHMIMLSCFYRLKSFWR